MAQAGPLLVVAGGIALIVAGTLILSRALRRLRRIGAFSPLYWASFRHYAGYRVRSLRPMGTGLLGIVMVAAGLVAVYTGMLGFYASRLGDVSS